MLSAALNAQVHLVPNVSCLVDLTFKMTYKDFVVAIFISSIPTNYTLLSIAKSWIMWEYHQSDGKMSAMASQIIGDSIVC